LEFQVIIRIQTKTEKEQGKLFSH